MPYPLLLAAESPERLLRLIRMCDHCWRGYVPPFAKEPYTKAEVREEIIRRFPSIFHDLGWSPYPYEIYKHRYTGLEAPLRELPGVTCLDFSLLETTISSLTHFNSWLQRFSWFILEYWYPRSLWEDSAYIPRLDPKNNPTQLELFKDIRPGLLKRAKSEELVELQA